MHETQGHVTVNGRMPNQRFKRFVDEKIKDWAREHRQDSMPPQYEVAFYDEDPLGEVSCLVIVTSKGHSWRSWETADNARLALRRSLANLHHDANHDELKRSGSEQSLIVEA